MTRSANVAMSGSCVTMTMVMPSSRLSSVRRFITSLEVAAVEVAGRLVGEHHLRPGDDRPGDGDALLLAAGKFVRVVAGAVGEADLVERRQRQPPPLAGRHAAIDQRHLDVLQRRGARQQVEALKDEAKEVAAKQRPLVAAQARRRRRP